MKAEEHLDLNVSWEPALKSSKSRTVVQAVLGFCPGHYHRNTVSFLF